MRVYAMTGIVVLAVCAASADTLKDGMVEVTPGRYQWKQETNIMAIPIREENIECLIPEESQMTLSKLARDLEEGCSVDNVREIRGGYLFKLICKGKTTGTADATLLHTDRSMTINAKGTANLGPIPAGFSIKAQATYMGACSDEESARARERYLRESAAVK